MIELREYRLLLVSPESRQLLGIRNLQTVSLPRVRVPDHTRPAKALTDTIRITLNIRSIVIDFLPVQERFPICAVVEILDSMPSALLSGLEPVGLDEINPDEFTHEGHAIVGKILTRDTEGRGPFSSVGWLNEAKQWIRQCLPKDCNDLTEDIRQLNAASCFALVRFGTRAGPAYWLKAVGEPNTHEFNITLALCKWLPRYLPPLVATRGDWNAWVTEEAGSALDDSLTLPALEQAVIALAGLQIESIPNLHELLLAGCTDQRLPVLEDHVGELITYLEAAMERQTSTKVPRLSTTRLHEIGRILRHTCAALHDLQIPDTLIHNDINPGNILYDGSRCVYTDWAEGYIGNPFLTLQQFFVRASYNQQATNWLPQLRALYKMQWLGGLTEAQFDDALVFAPLVAIASTLYGRGKWLASPHDQDTPHDSYNRSLARHMDRAAQSPELLRALCH